MYCFLKFKAECQNRRVKAPTAGFDGPKCTEIAQLNPFPLRTFRTARISDTGTYYYIQSSGILTPLQQAFMDI